MAKSIALVAEAYSACDLNGTEQFNFWSNCSIQHSDLAIFKAPKLPLYDDTSAPCLDSNWDDSYVKSVKHWNDEFTQLLSKGKTIFCTIDTADSFESPLSKHDNYYSAVPLLNLSELVSKQGTRMTLVPKERQVSESLWNSLRDVFKFQALIPQAQRPLILAEGTNSAVAAIFQNGPGRVVALPSLDLADETISNRIVAQLLLLDRNLRRPDENSPAPAWIKHISWTSLNELERRKHLIDLEIERLQGDENVVIERIREEKALLGLMYESGNPLEELVRSSLQLMGFEILTASTKVSDEIDVLFGVDDDEFLGEIEGRDAAQVNIDKLRQLEQIVTNYRYETEKNVQGILFGNAKRLTNPRNRGEQFTDKCLQHAIRSKFALVRTVDLFEPAQYLKNFSDAEYASACRQAIKDALGKIVVFPSAPTSTQISDLFETNHS